MSDREYYKPSQMLSLIESVRKRPGMYFGTTDDRGLQHVFLEIFSNAVDSSLREKSMTIKVHAISPEIIIEDNACGLPFDILEEREALSLAEYYLTALHQTRSADNHAPHIHLAYRFGVGLAAVNYVSSKLEIESWRDG